MGIDDAGQPFALFQFNGKEPNNGYAMSFFFDDFHLRAVVIWCLVSYSVEVDGVSASNIGDVVG